MTRSKSRMSGHYYIWYKAISTSLWSFIGSMYNVPAYVSFLEHTWQPESKQKCKAPNGCCEIYALKFTSLTYGRMVWVFPAGWFVFTLHPFFLFFLNGSVICALHIQSYSSIQTLLSNGSQPWLYIRMIEGAFKNTNAQAMPLDDCFSLWGALSPRGHLATSGDIFRYYKLLGGY